MKVVVIDFIEFKIPGSFLASHPSVAQFEKLLYISIYHMVKVVVIDCIDFNVPGSFLTFLSTVTYMIDSYSNSKSSQQQSVLQL